MTLKIIQNIFSNIKSYVQFTYWQSRTCEEMENSKHFVRYRESHSKYNWSNEGRCNNNNFLSTKPISYSSSNHRTLKMRNTFRVVGEQMKKKQFNIPTRRPHIRIVPRSLVFQSSLQPISNSVAKVADITESSNT